MFVKMKFIIRYHVVSIINVDSINGIIDGLLVESVSSLMG